MKTLCFFVCFLLLPLFSAAQSITEIKRQGSGFLWGEGSADDMRSADKIALDDLISQISVRVSSNFILFTKENNLRHEQFVTSALNTYSSVYLDGVKRRVSEEGKMVTVIRFIEENNLGELFASRKAKLLQFVAEAEQAEAEAKASESLRYYYWALLLLRSHPDQNKIMYSSVGQHEKLLLHILNDKILRILKGFSAELVSLIDDSLTQTRKAEIQFKWYDKPVGDYEFTYWTGNDWSKPSSAIDGIGTAEFFGEAFDKMSQLRIRTEYRFEHMARFDEGLRALMEMGNLINYPQCEFTIPLKSNSKAQKPKPAYRIAQAVGHNTARMTETIPPAEINRFSLKIEQIAEAIRQNKPTSVEPLFTPECFILWKKLFANAKTRLLEQVQSPMVYKYGGQYMVRSLPVSFDYQGNVRTFVENLVFYFNEQELISSFAFSLGNRSLQDILEKSDRFAGFEEKMQLIQFMENYKTAYSLKRLDFLQQIFADNALIIIGNKLVNDDKNSIEKIYRSLPADKYQYVKLNKKEYLERLRNVFRSNEFINIQFEDAQVKKLGGQHDNIFGIQIAQYYYSSNYADKGYLFLMIDMTDSLNPRIYVRSWQPEKYPDGSIIGLQDFSF